MESKKGVSGAVKASTNTAQRPGPKTDSLKELSSVSLSFCNGVSAKENPPGHSFSFVLRENFSFDLKKSKFEESRRQGIPLCVRGFGLSNKNAPNTQTHHIIIHFHFRFSIIHSHHIFP